MSEFSIRSYPQQGEDLQGYILRVAKENGRLNIKELLATIGYSKKQIFQSSRTIEEFLSETSSWYCRWPLDKLKLHFSESSNSFWRYQDKRCIRDVVIQQPRICIECLKSKESRYIKFEWGLLHNSYCESHECSLIDSCPSCGEQLDWDYKIFNQCTSCDFQWNNICLLEEPVDGYFQSEFNSLSENAKPQWYEEFTRLIMKAARPFDLMQQPITKLPKDLTQLNALVSQAKQLKEGRYSSENLIEWGPKGFVLTRRLKHEASMRYHQDFASVAKALNISSTHISHLIDQDVLKPLDPRKLIHIMLFDARSVQNLLERFSVIDKQTSDDVVMVEGHKLLTCYYLTFGEFLAQALKHSEVRRFSDGLESIVIEKKLAKKILFECMVAKLQDQHCTPYKVDRFLATATRKLKVADLLESHLIKQSNNGNAIDGQSFLKYIDMHGDKLKHRNKIINVYL